MNHIRPDLGIPRGSAKDAPALDSLDRSTLPARPRKGATNVVASLAPSMAAAAFSLMGATALYRTAGSSLLLAATSLPHGGNSALLHGGKLSPSCRNISPYRRQQRSASRRQQRSTARREALSFMPQHLSLTAPTALYRTGGRSLLHAGKSVQLEGFRRFERVRLRPSGARRVGWDPEHPRLKIPHARPPGLDSRRPGSPIVAPGPRRHGHALQRGATGHS
jgi:hypothetical protein